MNNLRDKETSQTLSEEGLMVSHRGSTRRQCHRPRCASVIAHAARALPQGGKERTSQVYVYVYV